MPYEVTAERIRIMAAAARVQLADESAARIAHAVTPTVARFAKENLSIPFETEPSTFTVVQRQDIGK
ncbi:MAG: hypothetical protein JWN71_3672 [Xanthobacteraceae bacterium]|jgi:hypothetical protein|nr:hypothetical protein [Xanthobacteraceae bacterium]